MKRSASLWMAVLTVTAVALGIVYLVAPQPAARADMLNVQNNFSMMTAGTPGGDEALIVIDKSKSKMVVFHLNGGNMDVLAATNFAR